MQFIVINVFIVNQRNLILILDTFMTFLVILMGDFNTFSDFILVSILYVFS